MRMAHRLELMGQDKYAGTTRVSGGRAKWNGVVRPDWQSLDIPRRWRKGRLVFVNSMSDLFHEDVPLSFIRAVFKTMRQTPQHTYQILTKRSERLARLGTRLDWVDNVWIGVSVESAEYRFRIDDLRAVPAAVRFLSLEPLLGPLENLDLAGIQWAIAGGESGPHARPMDPAWVRSIRDNA